MTAAAERPDGNASGPDPRHTQATMILSIESIAKSFGHRDSRKVLVDLSLELAEGEYIAIMGESGVGKSTLLNLIAGLDAPDTGSIVFAGQRFAALDDDARTLLRRAHMGFIFQAFHLLPHLTVERNIALPLALNGMASDAAERRVEELLASVGLSGRRHSAPSELSGGEMQRVAIARALAHRPRLVLADEPTGNLDAEAAGEVLALLRQQLRRDNAAGILVTHSELAARTTDRIYRLTADGLHGVAISS
jgi:putative ABC transport system ATP-binding protein